MRAVIALCLALTAAPLAASADPAPAVDPRVTLLERDALHARIWYWGFTGAYAISAVGQTTLALALDDPGQRADFAVGAGSSWLAVGGMVISPIPRVWRAAAEARRTGNIDAAINAAAEAENAGRAWYNHMLVGIVAVSAGLVLWVGFDRPLPAVLSFAENAVIGELNLLTIPTRSIRWHERSVIWSVAPTLHGLALVGAW